MSSGQKLPTSASKKHKKPSRSRRSVRSLSTNRVRTGWLYKQSRWMKLWRRRWMVLDGTMLASFKDAGDMDSPTEQIDLTRVACVSSAEEICNQKYSFQVYNQEERFVFYCASNGQKEDWIRSIGRAIVLSRRGGILQDDIPDSSEEEKIPPRRRRDSRTE
eukprot:405084_1